MRSLEEAQASWTAFERHGSSEELKNYLHGKNASRRETLAGLRSLSWKAFLRFKTLKPDRWAPHLKRARDEYESTKKRFLHGLQHQDEQDSLIDPLSDDSCSPWAALRQDETARQEIFQDVERCMPDNFYFRKPSTQSMLLDVLFIWSKLNPGIGYRQGMHEVLAPIIWVIERDAVPASNDISAQSDAQIVFNASFIEHDSFVVFNAVMSGLKSAYAPPPLTGAKQQAEPPIVPRANNITRVLLGSTDPLLAEHLAQIDMAPQLFIMRWIRLLFGREFPFDDMLRVWDLIFAEDASPDIIDLVCLAMLLRVRWQLVEASYNEALSIVLRYPPLLNGESAVSFVEDAIYLRKHLNIDFGYHIIAKYSGRQPPLVNRPISPSDTALLQTWKDNATLRSPSRRSDSNSRPSKNFEGMLHNAARGVFARGELLNRAVKDAVGEFKDNVQGLRVSRTDGHFREGSGSIGQPSESSDTVQTTDELHKRNKSLARMLESAVNDLWKQHKETVASGDSDSEQSKAFTLAIAKVQLAQVYLDDSSLPIPLDDDVTVSSNTPTRPSESPTPAESALEKSAPVHSRQPSTLKETANRLSRTPFAASEKVIPPSTPSPPKSVPAETGKTSRPPLEQSSFSFMLGQDDTGGRASRGAFKPATAFTESLGPREPSNLDFLFGESSESVSSRRPTAPTEVKKRPQSAAKEESEVVFDMENLSEVKL